MVNSGRNATRSAIPADPRKLDGLYQASLKLVLARKKRRAVRAIARSLRISHPTLLELFRDPKKGVSRKTKIKIIRAVNPAPPKKKKLFRPVVGLYYPDAL